MKSKNPMIGVGGRCLRNRKGLTLVELLVVILIIATLAAISTLAISRMKRSANSAKAVQSLRQVGSLVLGLAADQGGKLPDEGGYPNPSANPPVLNDTSWDGYVLAYIAADGVIPSTPPQVPVTYESMFWHGNDYPTPISTANYPTALRSFVYLRELGKSGGMMLSAISDPARTGMLGEHPWRTDGRNRVGFKSASFMDAKALIPDPKTGADLNPGGKFNFVFVDGHLEILTVKESVGTGSVASPRGLWTVTAND